jgi:mannosyltransferase OCH1-like enzyme
MIPKILHIVWVGGHRPPTEMIDSWNKKHAGDRSWFFHLWTQHDQGFRNQAQINARFDRKEYNGAADCMRYSILELTGGFCVDADSTCVKALDEGPEDFLSSTCALAAYENESVRPGIIGCGFLGAPKGHPFFTACVDESMAQDPTVMAWKAVGPLLMGRVAERMPGEIKVVPARHFNPVHYSGTSAPGNGEIYAQQGWGSTKGYGALRKLPCTCPSCWQTALRPSWG